ncbi:hypothetical protein OB905_09715 [Halobacteria archaeon AArc-dxtr1]|nr:hypothetical protein [Halobacteria archaeon AArc-dxtr1]
MSRLTALALTAVLTIATLSVAIVGAGAAATDPSTNATTETAAESDGYAGAHVAFSASGDALTDYEIDGDRQFENVTVASQSDHHAEAGGGLSLDAVANLSGLGLELAAESETRADVATEGSASIAAHDTDRGILTVDAGGESQYVEVALANESEAEADGDVVVVDSENRTGAFVVAGDGEVTVSDDGNVTADLDGDSTLVFRSYDDGERDDDAKEQEQLIADGTATAEIYVEERNGERVADVATYGHDVAVDAHGESEERVEMTVERAQHEGTIVITTVSEAAVEAAGSAEELVATVDGEVAAEASSQSDLEAAIGGEESAYMVQQSADGSADVLVAVNHFSERDVAVESADSGGDGGLDDVSGFGVGVTVLALLSAMGARLR